jgi:hypothetical protein
MRILKEIYEVYESKPDKCLTLQLSVTDITHEHCREGTREIIVSSKILKLL